MQILDYVAIAFLVSFFALFAGVGVWIGFKIIQVVWRKVKV